MKHTDAEITAVIEAYQAQAGTLGIRTYGPRNEKQRSSAVRYLSWCKKNDVDPKLYIEDRAQQARQNTRVQFPILGRLASTMSLQVHERMGRGRAEGARNAVPLVPIDTRRAERKLRPHQERFKSFYVGTPNEELCARFPQHSGGFNPASALCSSCRAQASCIEYARQEASA